MQQHDRTHSALSRRTFLISAGVAAIAAAAPASGIARALDKVQPEALRRLLHVAVGRQSDECFLHTYALEGETCRLVGRYSGERVSALTVHPTLPILYTASDRAESQSLPHGTVSAYQVEPNTGKLYQVARVSMSLSATDPRSMTVSLDGRYLLVSAFAGGAWNSFALDRSGMPAPTPHARKETGSGPCTHAQSSAHPFATIFVANSDLAIGTDFGCDRINALRPTPEGIELIARCDTQAGSGPSHAALFCDGRSLVVSHTLRPALSVHTLQSHGETRLETRSVLPMRSPVTVLVADPRAPLLYTVQALTANSSLIESWRLNSSGALSPIEAETLPIGAATSLAYDNGTLWAAVPQGLAQLRLSHAGNRPKAALLVGLPGGAHLFALQQFLNL